MYSKVLPTIEKVLRQYSGKTIFGPKWETNLKNKNKRWTKKVNLYHILSSYVVFEYLTLKDYNTIGYRHLDLKLNGIWFLCILCAAWLSAQPAIELHFAFTVMFRPALGRDHHDELLNFNTENFQDTLHKTEYKRHIHTQMKWIARNCQNIDIRIS